MLKFPEDINSKDFVLEGHGEYEKTMRHMRAYLDLCFEEWYLKQQKMIDSKPWELWKGGMETAFSKPAFKQAWEIIKKGHRIQRRIRSIS